MLYTNLNHIETEKDFRRAISENNHVVVIYGRMDPISIPVYRMVEELENEYSAVKFFDMEMDNPDFLMLPELRDVKNDSMAPLVICFSNGKVTNISTNIHSPFEIEEIVQNELMVKAGDIKI